MIWSGNGESRYADQGLASDSRFMTDHYTPYSVGLYWNRLVCPSEICQVSNDSERVV